MEKDQRDDYRRRWQKLRGREPSDPPQVVTAEEMNELNVEPLLLHLLVISDFCGEGWPEATENRDLVYPQAISLKRVQICTRSWLQAERMLRPGVSSSALYTLRINWID